MNYYLLLRNLNKYEMIPTTVSPYELIDRFPNDDWYISVYFFGEEHKAKYDAVLADFEANPEKYRDDKGQLKPPSGIAGLTGATTNRLVFDFDNEDNLDAARKDTLEIVDRLRSHGVPESAMQVCYSGSKGFSVLVKTDTFFNAAELKTLCMGLGGDLPTFDRKIYNDVRCLRLPLTRHQKTGHYKIPLSVRELEQMPLEAIKERSIDKTWLQSLSTDTLYMEECSLPISILSLNKGAKTPATEPIIETDVSAIDWSLKPRGMPNCKYALMKGFFKEGSRDHFFTVLAATLKAQYPDEKGIVYRMLKGVAENQARRNDMDRFPDKDIYAKVEQVFKPTWNGGQFSCKNNDELRHFCDGLGIHKCERQEIENEVHSMSNVSQMFHDYATNIDANTIKTGIVPIDEHIRITAGMHVGVLGCPGCHAKGTGIVMHDGSIKNVEDVIVGDLLMGPDSEPREVLKLAQGREEMVKITPERGESFVVNKSHMLHLTQSKLKIKGRYPDGINMKVSSYLEAKDSDSQVVEGLRLRKAGIALPEKELAIPPYIFGLWLGDGHSSSATLTSADDKIVAEWYAFADSRKLRVTKQEIKNNKASSYFVVGSEYSENTFLKDLRQLGVYNNKHIPEIYLTASRKQRMGLLAGLIDSDGGLEANKKGWEIIQKSKPLTDGIIRLARSLGYHASINEVKKFCTYKRKKVWGDYYSMYISAPDLTDVPVLLDRKKIKEKMISKDPLNYGFSCEPLPADDFYGFTLDRDHLYLTSDFFVHHNSGKTSMILNILNNTSKSGVVSFFFSMDMYAPLVYQKQMQKHTGLTDKTIFKMMTEDSAVIAKAERELAQEYENVRFCFKSGLTVEDIRNVVMQHQQDTGERVKLIAIDYAECISGPFSDPFANSRIIAHKLKDLASQDGFCVLTLVQPPKAAGDAATPLYSMRQVKGPSDWEQGFSIILGIYREGYNPNTSENDRFITINSLKNRMGPMFKADCSWNGLRGGIEELSHEEAVELDKLRNRKASSEDGTTAYPFQKKSY